MANHIKRIIRDRENFKKAHEFLASKYSFVYDFELGFLQFKDKEKSEPKYSDDYFGTNTLYVELIFNGLELKKSSIQKLIYLLAKPKENKCNVNRR